MRLFLKQFPPGLVTLIGLFTSLFCTTAFAQSDSTGENHILTILTHNPIAEKAYLHFDKPNYVAGDTIYFKAYLTIGERHKLSKASGVLYVDLIESKRGIVNSIMLQIIDGVGWGDFALPDSLESGNYRVRAYTNYMKNERDSYFDQAVAIKTAKIPNESIPDADSKPDIKFFPEGGQLVDGLLSKVGFKSTSSGGSGIPATGNIVDNTGNQLVKFSTSHLGMGEFFFRPEAGKTYKANVKFSDGTQVSVELPQAELKGIILSVKDTLDNLSIEIRCSRTYYQENRNEKLHLVFYSGGFAASVNILLDNRIIDLHVPKNKFSSGILLVGLFARSLQPISERLFFVSNPDLLNILVNSDKLNYKKGEKVLLNIKATTNSGIAADAHLSVSVINESNVKPDEDTENTILTSSLLKTAISEDIIQPNYYFTNNSKASADRDILMLTNINSRLSWKSLINDSVKVSVYRFEKGLTIAGTVKTMSGLPFANKDVFMIVPKSNNLLTCKTDDQGRFSFWDLVFMDGTSFIIKTSGSNTDDPTVITLNEDNTLPVVNHRIEGFSKDRVKTGAINTGNSGKSITLQVVSIKGVKTAHWLSSNSVNNHGDSKADQVINGDEIKNAPNLSSALNGLLRGVDFVRKRGVPYLQGFNEPLSVYVDGMPLDGGAINQINPNSVDRVELFKGANAGLYTSNGGGTIVITTKMLQSRSDGQDLPSGTLQITPRGFYNTRVFYSRNSGQKENNPNGKNPVSTVYWNPDLVTDKGGNVTQEYWNPEASGVYRVVVEGIDQEGNLGRCVYRYKVE